jgi:outer membrane lipoprotein
MLIVLCLALSSCAPVLSRTYLQEGSREISFDALRESPGSYAGKLYILGGIIVRSKFTQAGPQIEAVHVPVDGQGYFQEQGRSEGRFLAFLPGDKTALDPMVFRRGRRVTLAGVFTTTREGRIDEMEYTYPVFEIKQVYLWPKEEYYAAPPSYYDPWFYPWPYYYWEPWWSFFYYSAPVPSPGAPLLPPAQQPLPQHPRNGRDEEHERR